MPRQKKNNSLFEPQISIHTRITYYAGYLAVFILGYLGLRYINDPDPSNRTFGLLTLLESGFCLLSLLFTDAIRGHGMFPKPFRSISKFLVERTILIFIVIAGIQFIFIVIPFKIKTGEMALAVIFASISEELFFRGFIISFFISIGYNSPNKIRLTKKRSISSIEIIGIFLSSLSFALIHINYYGDISIMLTVFIGGLWLSIMFWWTRDLTSVMLAHFLLNFIVSIQTIWVVIL